MMMMFFLYFECVSLCCANDVIIFFLLCLNWNALSMSFFSSMFSSQTTIHKLISLNAYAILLLLLLLLLLPLPYFSDQFQSHCPMFRRVLYPLLFLLFHIARYSVQCFRCMCYTHFALWPHIPIHAHKWKENYTIRRSIYLFENIYLSLKWFYAFFFFFLYSRGELLRYGQILKKTYCMTTMDTCEARMERIHFF